MFYPVCVVVCMCVYLHEHVEVCVGVHVHVSWIHAFSFGRSVEGLQQGNDPIIPAVMDQDSGKSASHAMYAPCFILHFFPGILPIRFYPSRVLTRSREALSRSVRFMCVGSVGGCLLHSVCVCVYA